MALAVRLFDKKLVASEQFMRYATLMEKLPRRPKTLNTETAKCLYHVNGAGCWIWLKAKSYNGYGRASLNGRGVFAHRLIYELHKEPVPDGLEIDHLCRVRECVNPDHLEPVTKRENQRRSNSVAGVNMRKTHCDAGHELTGNNLYIATRKGRNPTRECRKCRAAASARRNKGRLSSR